MKMLVANHKQNTKQGGEKGQKQGGHGLILRLKRKYLVQNQRLSAILGFFLLAISHL
jgi:hypothetical protein